MDDVTIRRVQKGDEHTLAYIQTESWKAAFQNIIEKDLLDKCTDINSAADMYRGLLEECKGNGYILEVEGKPHCIAYWDASRDEDANGYAELICIHSLQDRWHKGYGSKMMKKILEDVQAAGYDKIMLWVFEENHRAIQFYKSHGFTANENRRPAFGAIEIMYERKLS